MATVIDSLLIELGLDSAKFDEGQKKAIASFENARKRFEEEAKKVNDSQRKSAEYWDLMKTKALEYTALLLGGQGFEEFIHNTLAADRETARFANTMGISAQTLQNWRGAAKLMGSDGDTMVNVLGRINHEIQSFKFTGQSDWLGWMQPAGLGFRDSNGNYLTADKFLLNLADAVQKLGAVDKAAAFEFASRFGVDMATFNTMVSGGAKAIQQFNEQARVMNPLTQEQVRIATTLANAWNKAELAVQGFARASGYDLIQVIKNANSAASNLEGSLTTNPNQLTKNRLLRALFGSGQSIFGFDFDIAGALGATSTGLTLTDRAAAQERMRAYGTPDKSLSESVTGQDPSVIEAYIRAGAIKRGLNPDLAVQVAKSEGLNKYVGDDNSSFGAYQLHVGGGLGDTFMKETGLDPRNPSTQGSQIDWVLDWVKAHGGDKGWDPNIWHGMRNPNFFGPGRMGSVTTNDVKIGQITINTQAKDAREIAANIGPILKGQSDASQANWGLG